MCIEQHTVDHEHIIVISAHMKDLLSSAVDSYMGITPQSTYWLGGLTWRPGYALTDFIDCGPSLNHLMSGRLCRALFSPLVQGTAAEARLIPQAQVPLIAGPDFSPETTQLYPTVCLKQEGLDPVGSVGNFSFTPNE